MTEAYAAGSGPPTLLVLTVGGSAEPLQTALRQCRPDEVMFIVSERTETTKSSEDMLPQLRQTEGCPKVETVLRVPADDPDRAFALVETELARALDAGKRVVADYTGGTKSMSVALVMAAQMLGGVALQVTTGQRINLLKVADGSEAPRAIADTMVSHRLTLALVEQLVARRAYASALAICPDPACAGQGLPKRWRSRLALVRNALALLTAWDRFDHKAARKVLADRAGGCDGRLGQWLAQQGLVERLKALDEAHGKPSAALCEDLWWNAQRRADQGAYDDAVARLYRLAEAAVQAHLFTRHGINTDCVPRDRLPEELRAKATLTVNHNGTVKLALADARKLLAHLEPSSPVPALWNGELADWQGQRNRSILAHGFRPLDRKRWSDAQVWFSRHAETLWRGLPSAATWSQLPDSLPPA